MDHEEKQLITEQIRLSVFSKITSHLSFINNNKILNKPFHFQIEIFVAMTKGFEDFIVYFLNIGTFLSELKICHYKEIKCSCKLPCLSEVRQENLRDVIL